MEAVNDVMTFAATRPEIDPTRFAIFGYSMGTGLARNQAVRDPRVKAVAMVSGAYPPIKPNKKLPPLLILHGSKDQSTPLKYVEQYVEGLKEQEMPHAIQVYKGVGHNFGLEKFADATNRSIAFFDRHVKSPATPR
jgi:dienelactone hydrolase